MPDQSPGKPPRIRPVANPNVWEPVSPPVERFESESILPADLSAESQEIVTKSRVKRLAWQKFRENELPRLLDIGLILAGCWLVYYFGFTRTAFWWLLGFAVAGLGLTRIIEKRRPGQLKAMRIIGAVVTACGIVAWSMLTSFDEVKYEAEGINFFTIKTSRKHFTNRPFYQFATLDGKDIWLEAEGPLTESMKRHGHWKTNGTGYNKDQWYWYGEEVTEGQWHLRNK